MKKVESKKRVVSRKKQTKTSKAKSVSSKKEKSKQKVQKPVKNSSITVKKGAKFVKGQSGNPKGRPIGSTNKFSVALLQKALQTVEKRKKKLFLVKWIESAWGNATDMANIANFMLPKLKSIEQITLPADTMTKEQIADARKEFSNRFETK